MGEFRFDKPWGWDLVWDVMPDVIGRVVHVKRGHRLWVDAPSQSSERIVLCCGLLMLAWEDEAGRLHETALRPGHVHEIPRRTPHRMIAIEDSDVVVVGPPTLDDVLRVDES